MLTEDQVHTALTGLLGYDAIDALTATADSRGDASLAARGSDGPMLIELTSTTDTTAEARYQLHIGGII